MSFKRFLLLTAVSSSILITATAGKAEPLAHAVEAALNTHPSVEAIIASRDALREDQNEAWSGYLPEVNVRATGGRIFGDNSTSRGLDVTRGIGYSYLWEGGVTLTQLLFDGFETTNRIDAAAARRQSANYTIMDVREELALRTVVAYLDVLRTQEAVNKLESQAKKIDSYIVRIRGMVEDGGGDESMLVQAADIKAQLENTKVNMKGQLASSIAAYREVVGHDPQGDDMDRPVPQLDRVPEAAGDAVAFAQEKHPVILQAALAANAYEHDSQAERAALYPDFTGELSYLKRDQEDVIGGEVRDAKAVVRMNWNYALGGAQHARIKSNMYREVESRAKLEEMKRQVAREVETAYSDRNTARQQVVILQERVQLNRDLLKTYQSQFEAARVSVLQLMQTDNTKFNAEMALLNGEYRALAAHYAVLASMGQLQTALNIVPAVENDSQKQ